MDNFLGLVFFVSVSALVLAVVGLAGVVTLDAITRIVPSAMALFS